jgi:hypothetical protein
LQQIREADNAIRGCAHRGNSLFRGCRNFDALHLALSGNDDDLKIIVSTLLA